MVFNKDSIKNHNENSDVGYFLEIDEQYPKKLFSSHLTFLPERKKIRKNRKPCLGHRRQRKICHSHKSLKTSTKSWINTKKGTQSN